MNRIVMISTVVVLAVGGFVVSDRCLAEDPPIQILLTDPPAEIPAELLSEFLIEESGADAARITAAVQQYLKEIDDIEKAAADQRAQARVRLVAAIEAAPQAAIDERHPGLVGGSTVNGVDGRYVFEYQHGMMFDRELVSDRFHDGDTGPFPSVTITLQGYVEVPNDMTVMIRNAGGGVSADHAELFLNDQSIGVVGDDVAKKAVYVVELPRGTHRVRWELSAGTFQHCMLKFEDPRSGDLLEVYHTSADREVCHYDSAREVVAANADFSTWPQIDWLQEWQWTPVSVGF